MKKDEQTYEALPIEVVESALSPAKMKVLNVLYRYNTLDTTIENGAFYISNEDLKTEAQIGDNKKTFYDVISFLNSNNFITRQSGSRTKEEGAVASTYVLHTDVILDWAIAHPKKGKGTPKMGTPKKSKCTDEVVELRAEVKSLREEVAELRALLMGTPMGTPNMGLPMEENCNRCTPEPELKKETTYHSVPEYNSSDSVPSYAHEDEVEIFKGVVNDETVAPLNGEDDEAFLSTLEGNLRNGKTTLQPDEVIALSKRVAEIFTKRVDDYKSPTSKKAAECFGLLLNRCVTLDSLAQLEKEVKGNLHHTNRNSEIISTAITIRRAAIKEGTANIASGSVADTAEVQTTIGDEKTQQGASQRANQGSGVTDTIPHDGETSQTSKNKASGSVSAPQMGKLSTDDVKHAQTRPDEAREAMTVDIPIDRMATKIANLNEAYETEEDMEARNIMQSKANDVATKMCDRCGKIPTIEGVNWGLAVIPKMINQFGKILGTMAGIYLNAAVNALNRRRKELLAA